MQLLCKYLYTIFKQHYTVCVSVIKHAMSEAASMSSWLFVCNNVFRGCWSNFTGNRLQQSDWLS